jgi:hypothetical protein
MRHHVDHRRPRIRRAALAAAAIALAAVAPAAALRPRTALQGLDTAALDSLTSGKGTIDPASGVYRVSVPRGDLHVRLGGVELQPRQGIASWVALQPAVDGAVLMGDVVVLAGELDPVVSAALDSGLEVTGIHNHFVGEEPRLLYVHVAGHGTAETLATAVGKLLGALQLAHGRALPALAAGGGAALDAKALDAALQTHGELTDGVYRAVFGESVAMHGERLGAQMGVATWAAFGGSADHAVVDGDFAMHEAEVRPVLLALRQGGISVVALHGHMLEEQPRLAFLHYWGTGAAGDLAKTLRAALDAQRHAREAAERH